MQIDQTSNDCYDLPVSIGNSTFCGVTKKWTPRFDWPILLVMSIIPVALYWIILFLYIKALYRKLNWMYWISKNSISCTSLEETGKPSNGNIKCGTPCCKINGDRVKLYFLAVIMVLFKYFWDAIDLTLDVYIFYQLERGEVIDGVIYRSINVNNAIYIFALFGCICKFFT